MQSKIPIQRVEDRTVCYSYRELDRHRLYDTEAASLSGRRNAICWSKDDGTGSSRCRCRQTKRRRTGRYSPRRRDVLERIALTGCIENDDVRGA